MIDGAVSVTSVGSRETVVNFVNRFGDVGRSIRKNRERHSER